MKKRSNKNIRVAGFSPTANPEFAEAMRDIRRGNATSRHLNAQQKQTRAVAKRHALRDQD